MTCFPNPYRLGCVAAFRMLKKIATKLTNHVLAEYPLAEPQCKLNIPRDLLGIKLVCFVTCSVGR